MNVNTAQEMYDSMRGTYVGNVMVDNLPQKIYVTIANDFTVKQLPLKPLLQRVFTDETEMEAALKSAQNVVFTAPTKDMAIVSGNAYLFMEPTDLVFNVTVDGKTKAVSALLESTAYVNRPTDELSLNIDVKELSYDGKSYDLKTNGIKYVMDNAKKEQN
jgi:hypothetical protein